MNDKHRNTFPQQQRSIWLFVDGTVWVLQMATLQMSGQMHVVKPQIPEAEFRQGTESPPPHRLLKGQ